MLLHLAGLTAPLFLLVALGYGLSRFGWPRTASDALTRFVFVVAVPTLLFRLMSDFSRLPRVDARLLIAFFGGCLLVYAIGRIAGALLFRMDGVSQSVFATGGIFSNNVLLGIPLARATLGDASLPAVTLVLVFNSLILWTLVSVSVEWARQRDLSPVGLARTAKGVLRNPVVASIIAGTAFGFIDVRLPAFVDHTLAMISVGTFRVAGSRCNCSSAQATAATTIGQSSRSIPNGRCAALRPALRTIRSPDDEEDLCCARRRGIFRTPHVEISA